MSFTAKICDAWNRFFLCYPALLYAIALLLGVSWALNPSLILIIPILLLGLPLLHSGREKPSLIRLSLAYLFLLTGFFWIHAYYSLPSLDDKEIRGSAHLNISSIALVSTPFGSNWSYKGSIETFLHSSKKWHHLPFIMSIPQKKRVVRPPANTDYLIDGLLKEYQPGRYLFIPSKEAPWSPIKGSWSPAEIRLSLKNKIKKHLSENLPDKRSAAFLTGLSIGEFDDRQMQFEFSRFGLQHIMAISGFHFAILAAILSQFLSLIFSKRWSTAILIFLMSSYFLFLGSSPSIMRAWVMISVALLGMIFEKQSSGLNTLGIALIAVLLIDPLSIQNIGFQFSFATTAAILLFFAPLDIFLQKSMAKRSLSIVSEMSIVDQHGYLAITFIRQALALAGAVNLIALPMTLLLFNKFPLLSLIYNLFFPFLVSISMLLLLIATPLTFIAPPLGSAIHFLNSLYTQFVLNFAYHLPINWDYHLRTSALSFEFIICYLCALFYLGIYVQYLLKKRHDFFNEFRFL